MTNFKFKKKYGQNFLTSDTISECIIDSIKPKENDLIIEIGPGGGALTKKLKRYNCPIIAYEIDKDTSKFLKNIEDEKTKIIYEDFMSAKVKEELQKYEYNNLYIIGNLPYYITTPILERIIDLKIAPKEVVIMVQKEVADRFLAKTKTKDYGYMTVLLNYHFDITKVVDVPRKHFNPMPNVDSAVVKLSKKNSPKADYDKFKQLLKDSFQFKRKTINNNLKKYDLEKVKNILESHGYSLSSRAEEIDLDTFIALTEVI